MCKCVLICSVVSDSLQPHGLQHTRTPRPSPTPRASSNSYPSRRCCHLTISSSVVPVSSHLQSFPASGSFSMSRFFAQGGPNCWRFSFSISPSNEYSGLISFRMDWFDLLAVQGTLKSLLNTIVQKHQFFGTQLSSQSNSHIYTQLTGKTIALTRRTFVRTKLQTVRDVLLKLPELCLTARGSWFVWHLPGSRFPFTSLFCPSSKRLALIYFLSQGILLGLNDLLGNPRRNSDIYSLGQAGL